MASLGSKELIVHCANFDVFEPCIAIHVFQLFHPIYTNTRLRTCSYGPRVLSSSRYRVKYMYNMIGYCTCTLYSEYAIPFVATFDYQEGSLELKYTVPAEVCLEVPIINDNDTEPTETFAVSFVIESRNTGLLESDVELATCTVDVFLVDDDIPLGKEDGMRSVGVLLDVILVKVLMLDWVHVTGEGESVPEL